MPSPPPTPQHLSRRGFMRRMLGVGVGILSLEFFGGTLSFLWPNITAGLGAEFRVGTNKSVLSEFPQWAQGWPYSYHPASAFIINVAAAKELALGREASVTDPAEDGLLALYGTCPHLGCQVPDLCESVKRFQCRCHGSVYNIIGEKQVRGPAERGMDRFAVRIDAEGVVIVDTRRIIGGPPTGTHTFSDAHPLDAVCAEV